MLISIYLIIAEVNFLIHVLEFVFLLWINCKSICIFILLGLYIFLLNYESHLYIFNTPHKLGKTKYIYIKI